MLNKVIFYIFFKENTIFFGFYVLYFCKKLKLNQKQQHE